MTESRSMIANSMISFPLPKMETHSVYTLLCLASFPQHNYFEIHSCCCWVGIHHNLFIHLCVDGYIITNLLLFWKNFCKHFCINLLWNVFSFLSVKYIGVELLSHGISVCFTLLETFTKTSPKWSCHFTQAPAKQENYSCSISSRH